MRLGWRKGEMRGEQDEKERQNKFLPPPYTNPVYATGRRGHWEIVQHRHRERFHFDLKMH